jgi:thiamine biosynthesis protein ThiI
MKPEVVIVRLGDLTLKGRNRYRFEQQVRWQIQALLSSFKAITIRGEFARLYISLNGEPYDAVAETLKLVFGIGSFSPAIKADIELQSIQSTALQWMRMLPFQPKSFRVTVKRGFKEFPYDSLETSYWVGGYVLAGIEGLKVDVHQPEVELHVDIRPEAVYIFTEVIAGTGGFPIGSNGKAILMLSGGIDSPVAGWLAMRQGLEIEAIHFHSFPYTSERAKQKVIDLTHRLSLYGGSIKLHLISYAAIQTRLQLESQANLLVTFMRRSMLRITEQLAMQQKALGIVSGESLGQVASQTLSSLHTIGQAAQLQLLRPLIMTDKNAIIRLAEQIGTFAISILPFEDCCTLFVPKAPSTNPNLKVVDRLEKAMPWLHEAEKNALETREIQTLSWHSEKAFNRYFT